MGDSVTGKFNVFIFKKVDSEEIADGMVFEFNTVSGTVDHFLSFEDFDSLSSGFFVEHFAQFKAVVLAHGLEMKWGCYSIIVLEMIFLY